MAEQNQAVMTKVCPAANVLSRHPHTPNAQLVLTKKLLEATLAL